MSDYELFISKVQENLKIDKKIDTTPSLDLLDANTASEIKKILGKLKSNNNIKLTADEKFILLNSRDQIQKQLRQQVTMCKIIPIGDINQYLSFNYDIGNFMLRRADLHNLIQCNYCNNIIDTLYHCLRLDYGHNSPFSSCNRLAVVELKIDNFACRVPLANTEYEKIEDKKININYDDPYTGVGWTKSCYGVPEFYVTIANEEKSYINTDGNLFSVGLGKFPLMAFDTNVYVADRNLNSLIKIACYFNEGFDDGYQQCGSFEQCNDIKTKEVREMIIRDEDIVI